MRRIGSSIGAVSDCSSGIMGAVGLTQDSTAWISVSHTTRFRAHLAVMINADPIAAGRSAAGISAPIATSQTSTR
ncbi:hypothetical protein D3C81_1982420 [compost metagenome]